MQGFGYCIKQFLLSFVPRAYGFNWFVFFIVALVLIAQCYTLFKCLKAQPHFGFNDPAPSERSDIANSNLIVDFDTTMAKMQEMEKTLLTSIENKKDIYGSEILLSTIKKLKTIDTSTNKGKSAIVYLFNNGKFRTQKQLEEFVEVMEQDRYAKDGFQKEEAELLAKRLTSTQVTNALILNPVLCPFATPICYGIAIITITILIIVCGKVNADFISASYNWINKVYLGLFLLFLVIDYFIFGGIQLVEEIETEQELKEIYKKAGLKKPSNKMLMVQCGLYGANLLSLGKIAKSLKS